MRFGPEHVERWREDGFVVIERFFREDELGPVLEDFERLYGRVAPEAADARRLRPGDDERENRALQFKNIDVLPFDASATTNLIALHPELIAFAQALLGADDVHLYQAHTWAKFTGEADYDQPFHCDYGNHTLLVPAEDPARRTVDFVLYFTEVTPEHGAMRYVTKPDVLDAFGKPLLRIGEDQQALLRARERAVVGPAGTLVAHGIDTVHRGSNLTKPGGRRFSLTAGYKAAGNDLIGFHVWQARHNRPWDVVMRNATPEQLACLGIPLPGDPFWTPHVLQHTQARWPDWDMRAYFAACPDSP